MPTKTKSIVSRNLETLWKDSRLSQEDFGQQFDSNFRNVNAYIRGINKPNAFFLEKLATHYLVTSDFLLNTLIKLKDGKIINFKGGLNQKQTMIAEIEKLRKIQNDFAKAFSKECDRLISDIKKNMSK